MKSGWRIMNLTEVLNLVGVRPTSKTTKTYMKPGWVTIAKDAFHSREHEIWLEKRGTEEKYRIRIYYGNANPKDGRPGIILYEAQYPIRSLANKAYQAMRWQFNRYPVREERTYWIMLHAGNLLKWDTRYPIAHLRHVMEEEEWPQRLLPKGK